MNVAQHASLAHPCKTLRECAVRVVACLADAADDEGKCLKAEVEILRSQARRNADTLSQHLSPTEVLPTAVLPAANNSMQATSPAAAPWAEGLPMQQTLAGACSAAAQKEKPAQQQQHWQQQHSQPQQHAQQQLHSWQQQQQQLQQQHGQSSGEASSELELAAVEQGLSALDHQITAAALRYALSLII